MFSRVLKYKIYFNHKIKNSFNTKCFDYSVFLTHVNIVWHCRSIQSATSSHRTSEHNVEREKGEAKFILQLRPKLDQAMPSQAKISVARCTEKSVSIRIFEMILIFIQKSANGMEICQWYGNSKIILNFKKNTC